MKLVYKCAECGEICNSAKHLGIHIAKFHKFDPEQYYVKHIMEGERPKCPVCSKNTELISIEKGFREFCSKSCRMKYQHSIKPEESEELTFHCNICGYDIKGIGQKGLMITFSHHLKTTHNNMTIQQYYDRYLKKYPTEGVCAVCGEPVRFINITLGYSKICSKCACTKAMQERESKDQVTIKDAEKAKEFQAQLDDYAKYLQEEAKSYDWSGTRASWEYGNKPQKIDTTDNILTDNSLTFIDGQNYNFQAKEIDESCETSIDDVFWL